MELIGKLKQRNIEVIRQGLLDIERRYKLSFGVVTLLDIGKCKGCAYLYNCSERDCVNYNGRRD